MGELALGNVPLTQAWMLVLLAPMYGGGALLVREAGRRTRAGWPVMVVLAAAYALLEEGPIDQMLFNPAYLGLSSFEGFAPVPGLALSARLTQESLAIHTAWSICVPIAVVEAFDPRDPAPWLGRRGLALVSAVFVLGSTALALLQVSEFHFVAGWLELGVVGLAVVGLVAGAWAIRRGRPGLDQSVSGGAAPAPRRVAAGALLMSSAYWLVDIFVPDAVGAWVSIACCAALAASAGIVLLRLSRRPGWGRPHRLGVAVGVLATYLWVSYVNSVFLGVPLLEAVVGSTLLGAGVVVLLVAAVRAERRRRRPVLVRSA